MLSSKDKEKVISGFLSFYNLKFDKKLSKDDLKIEEKSIKNPLTSQTFDYFYIDVPKYNKEFEVLSERGARALCFDWYNKFLDDEPNSFLDWERNNIVPFITGEGIETMRDELLRYYEEQEESDNKETVYNRALLKVENLTPEKVVEVYQNEFGINDKDFIKELVENDFIDRNKLFSYVITNEGYGSVIATYDGKVNQITSSLINGDVWLIFQK